MVREAYFDAPNLGRLIQDVWNNRALCHRAHQSSTTRDVALFPGAGPRESSCVPSGQPALCHPD